MVSSDLFSVAYTFTKLFKKWPSIYIFFAQQNKWDLENNEENRKKIWTIANERYKGWRSTLSATYRAYTTDDERMRHKPEELDIVEWHYLVMYFGSEEFQV